MNQYAPLSGLADQDNDPSNWALGFCISNFLIELKPGRCLEAFEQLFNGSGYWSDDGWELCRWQHRYLGSEVLIDYSGNGFLAWTDPEDHGFEPSWRIYDDMQFKEILKRSAQRHMNSVVGAKAYEAELMQEIDKWTASIPPGEDLGV